MMFFTKIALILLVTASFVQPATVPQASENITIASFSGSVGSLADFNA